jgi:ribosome-binding protein aMBF1 (putative translation factor)
MNALAPTPLSVTDSTVTFSRTEWEAFLDRLEDMEDEAVIAASLAERARIGDAEYRRLCYTSEEAARIIDDGVSRVTIWRERTGLTPQDLAAAVGISVEEIAAIEGGKMPSDPAVVAALAKALTIPVTHLA